MNKDEIVRAYVLRYPCLYMGQIQCADCERVPGDPDESCDMAACRIHEQKMFVDGWNAHERATCVRGGEGKGEVMSDDKACLEEN